MRRSLDTRGGELPMNNLESTIVAVESIAEIILTTGSVVVFMFFLYIFVGITTLPFYSTQRSDERTDKFRLVLTTVAEPHIRNALMETIDHHLEHFPEYEFFVIMDEGSELGPELRARNGIQLVTVPDEYNCKAEAKGRAINYFIETVVADAPEYWYGFIDDDNRILDDEFLYEIPHYDEKGYGAMNPVLVPRLGRSKLAYVEDHMRLLEDLTLFRFFAGVLGKPYLGLHGELLTIKGEVMVDITFDRKTIVEDFAFAMELCRKDIKTWQSASRVSILSPHTVRAWLKQRRRWYIGIVKYLPHSPPITKFVVGLRQVLIALSVTAVWFFAPLWLFFNLFSVPTFIYLGVLLGSLIHFGTCLYGAYRIEGLRSLYLGFFTPFYALMEQSVPIYSALTANNEFVVIEK